MVGAWVSWTGLTALVLLGLLVWSFHARHGYLMASPYPVGVDGYFYPIQVRSLLSEGRLHYPSAPLALWFMAPFAALENPVDGAKIAAALGSALMVLPAYLLGRRVGGSRATGLLAAVLVGTSAESFYLSAEFVKNGLGLTVAASFLCALAWAADATADATAGEHAAARRPRGPWLLAGTLLLATALTHKLALAVALLASAPLLWHLWHVDGVRPQWRRAGAVSGRAVAILALVLVAALIAVLSMPAVVPEAGDLALLGDLVAGPLDPSLPALARTGQRTLWFQYEVAIAGALALGVLVAIPLLRRWSALTGNRSPAESRARSLAVGLAAVGLLCAWPMADVSDPQGLGFRVRLLAFLPLAVCAAALVGEVARRLQALPRAALVLPFLLAFAWARPVATGEGVVVVHPATQAGIRALAGSIPDGDVVVVPERRLMFMVTWYTGRPAVLRPDSIAPERRWRLLPDWYRSDPLDRAVREARATRWGEKKMRPRDLHPRHRDALILVPEATWQVMLSSLPERLRKHYARWPTL